MIHIGGEIESNILNYNKSPGICEGLNSYYFYDSGRSALHEILANEQLKKKKFLIPSYTCMSVIQPFLNNNIEFDFYKINQDLKIDLNEIHDGLDSKNFDVLLLIDYFGFTPPKSIIELLKNQNILIIEDVSHMSFLPILLDKYDPYGDIVYGSLRKILPVSDGGFILKSDEFTFNVYEKQFAQHALYKAGSLILKELYLLSRIKNIEYENLYLSLSKFSEKLLDSSDSHNIGVSPLTFNILNSINYEQIYLKRRANYTYLEKLLCERKEIEGLLVNPILQLDTHIMPYLLPLKIENKRDYIRQKLIESDIFTPIIWDIGESKYTKQFSASLELCNQILCLPIDQRYNMNDMEIIVKELFKYL
jgi:dTDP-4-amino-4,6-dideoxygalactose transaminase